jgi:hypothetical protein
MDPTQERQANQTAYRQLRDSLTQTYPPGRFVAIAEGRVAADAETFDDLRAALRAGGMDPSQALIVQAGVEYPETAVIFAQDGQP